MSLQIPDIVYTSRTASVVFATPQLSKQRRAIHVGTVLHENSMQYQCLTGYTFSLTILVLPSVAMEARGSFA